MVCGSGAAFASAAAAAAPEDKVLPDRHDASDPRPPKTDEARDGVATVASDTGGGAI